MTPVEVARKLEELAGRVEKATGPDREIDARIARAVGKIPQSAAYEGTIKMGDLAWSNGCGYEVPSFTASIDAAMTLVPEEWLVLTLSEVAGDGMAFAELANPFLCGSRMGIAKDMALALTASCLRARALRDLAGE